jgi:hypothetical protein
MNTVLKKGIPLMVSLSNHERNPRPARPELVEGRGLGFSAPLPDI